MTDIILDNSPIGLNLQIVYKQNVALPVLLVSSSDSFWTTSFPSSIAFSAIGSTQKLPGAPNAFPFVYVNDLLFVGLWIWMSLARYGFVLIKIGAVAGAGWERRFCWSFTPSLRRLSNRGNWKQTWLILNTFNLYLKNGTSNWCWF